MKKEDLTLPQKLRSKEVGEGLVVKNVLGDRVLVSPIIPKTDLDRFEASGLALPEGAKEKLTPLPSTGIIIAIGEGVSEFDRNFLSCGGMVLYDRHAGTDWLLNREAFRILLTSEILCVLDIAGE